MRVACIRDVGSTTEVDACFQRLFRWASVIGAPTGRLLTLSFHLPDTAPSERWFWKAGAELHTHDRPPPWIELETLGAGRHAVFRLTGPHEGIGEAYRRLFEEWLPKSGELVAAQPCMELYRNTPRETAPARLITDLCLPLQAPPSGTAPNLNGLSGFYP